MTPDGSISGATGMAMAHAPGGSAIVRRPGSRALFEGAGVPLIVFIWAMFALATAFSAYPAVMDQLSTDDAMRLAEVRDLLAGQSWFDLAQHRLNPPEGVVMHWSRVVDLPIALILAAAERLLPPDLALTATLIAWPLLLLLPALLAVASAARSLGGPQAAALGAFMTVMSPGVTVRFAPGALDHHGAQLALALGLLACALRIDRSARAAVGAGLCAALMMAIGMETAPHVAACAAVIALRWAFTGDPGVARGARLFGLVFAAGVFAVALLTLSPASWSAPVCDTIGRGHLAVALAGGLGLALAATAVQGVGASRFAALGAVGAAVLGALVASAPNCLASPYGSLPEKLRTDWLANVQEAQNVVSATIAGPTSALAVGPALLALILIVGWAVWSVRSASSDARWRIWTAAAMFAAALAVTAWQIRGASLVFALGAPFLPLPVLALARRGGRARAILALIAFAPVTLTIIGLQIAAAAGLPSLENQRLSFTGCPAADYRALRRLTPGLALNTIDTGPFILAFSPHAVVGAPYHRNVDGMMAELEAFQGSEETARAVALSRGADYVVVCTVDAGVRPNAKAHPDGFSAMLLSGDTPSWLRPVDLGPDAKLRAFEIVAGRRTAE